MADKLLENISKLYIFIIIGLILGLILSFKKIDNSQETYRDKTSKMATSFLIKILTPIIIFLTLTTTQYEIKFNSVIQIITLEVFTVLFAWLCNYFLLKKMNYENKVIGTILFLNGFPNILIYSIPIILSAFNEELIIIPTIFASSALVVRGLFSNYIGIKLGNYNDNKTKGFLETFIDLIKFPPLIGILIGMIFILFKIPTPLTEFLLLKSYISPIYSGLGGIILGMILSKLTKSDIKPNLKNILFVAFWRFIISFIIFSLVVNFLYFPVDQVEIRTILLINVIGPPAVINVAFSLYYDFDDKLAAVSVALLTLIALILLPFIITFGLTYY